MSWGGKREGAGRRPVSLELRRQPVGVSLPGWLVDWLAEQPNRSLAVEEAIVQHYRLTPPNTSLLQTDDDGQ